ncbi:unnamed protein product [Larinioides sclopetarius]|uniref:Uncharacterized protein n=1 Tax=Larinioides sclopetarius TaxID=280406 RepID=A0AAV2AZM5_9ARAC
MYKVKLLVIGPCECGKTVISNFLADATETIPNEYYPTQGVRYANFVQTQGLKDAHCMVFCHRKPNQPETRSSELSSLFSRIPWLNTSVEENGGALRREFNSFLQRLLSNISERRDQEELSILNQH